MAENNSDNILLLKIAKINQEIPVWEAMNKEADTELDEASLPAQIQCMFHNDNSPSMRVYPEDRGAYCWGCGKAYFAWDVIKRLNGFTTAEALQYIEQNYNIDLKDLSDVEIGKNQEALADYIIYFKKHKDSINTKELEKAILHYAKSGSMSKIDKIWNDLQDDEIEL